MKEQMIFAAVGPPCYSVNCDRASVVVVLRNGKWIASCGKHDRGWPGCRRMDIGDEIEGPFATQLVAANCKG